MTLRYGHPAFINALNTRQIPGGIVVYISMEFNEEASVSKASLGASSLTPYPFVSLFNGDRCIYKQTPRSQRQSNSLNPASSGYLGIKTIKPSTERVKRFNIENLGVVDRSEVKAVDWQEPG